MALKIGITGGIGSGKTVVSRLLRIMGIPVYISDIEARRLMQGDANVRRGLTDLIGPGAYTPDGQLNKAHIATYLFASPEHAAQVNAIVHPRVRQDFRLWAARLEGENLPTVATLETDDGPSNPPRATHSPRAVAPGDPARTAPRLIGMESAILIEAGFRQEVDRLVVVTAPLPTRIVRAMQRDHASRNAVEQRILAQMAEEDRCRQADFIICNDGVRPLIPQVIELVHRLSLSH